MVSRKRQFGKYLKREVVSIRTDRAQTYNVEFAHSRSQHVLLRHQKIKKYS